MQEGKETVLAKVLRHTAGQGGAVLIRGVQKGPEMLPGEAELTLSDACDLTVQMYG